MDSALTINLFSLILISKDFVAYSGLPEQLRIFIRTTNNFHLNQADNETGTTLEAGLF